MPTSLLGPGPTKKKKKEKETEKEKKKEERRKKKEEEDISQLLPPVWTGDGRNRSVIEDHCVSAHGRMHAGSCTGGALCSGLRSSEATGGVPEEAMLKGPLKIT